MKLNTSSSEKTRAQAMVEFAIVLPILLLLLYGLLEAGRLLFIYSSIVTASRQASRYGSATGQGGDYTAENPAGPNNSSLARYQDCYGIRRAAERVDFLNSFNGFDLLSGDITITYDNGIDASGNPIPVVGFDGICDGTGDSGVSPSTDNTTRIVVTINGNFFPIVPRIVPFLERSDTSTSGPIRAISARTIVIAVPIEVTSPPGSGPAPGTGGLSLIVTPTPATFTAAGETISYKFTVNNGSSTDLLGPININDSKFGPFVCSTATLAAGTSVECTLAYVTTPADVTAGSIFNSAKASASDGTNTVESNEATASVTLAVQESLTLTKTASPQAASIEGTIITYTFTLTNSGNVTLSPPFRVDDQNISPQPFDCPAAQPTELAPGAAISCTATYSLTRADINRGTLVNTAKASATFNSQPIESSEATVTVFTPPLYLTASVSPTSVNAAGQTVTYTYTFHNNTDEPLSNFGITGSRVDISGCLNSQGSLAAGASFTCTGTYTITQADINNGGALSNTVTGSAQLGNKNETSNSVGPLTVTIVTNPTFTLQSVTASPSPATTLGTVVTYTYTLVNSGNVALTPTITDTKVTNITCPAGGMAPGATQTCTGTYTVTAADIETGSIVNQGNASATFQSQTITSGPVSTTVITYQGARLRLRITANPAGFTGAGQYIIYTYTLVNTGSKPLNGPYLISDNTVPFVDCSMAASPLAVGASTACVASYLTTGTDMAQGHVANSARATSSDGTQTITSNLAVQVIYLPGAATVTPSPIPTSTSTATPTATGAPAVCAATTVTLTATADAYVDENSAASNFGSATTLNVQSRSTRDQRALVQFTLPSIPAGCKIGTATLRLTASPGTTGRTLQALQLSASWTETGVTWNNQPGTTGTAATTASANGTVQWTVTSIVQSMYSGTNNGFVIRDANEDAVGSGILQTFFSRENSSTNKPQLVITFVQAP